MTTDNRSPIAPVGVRPAAALTVAFLLLGSGLCALVYQIAWLRLLRLTFGASTAASAVVLAIFMGGLGLGGLLLGKRAQRSANPLALYGWLETWIAVGAGLSPWLIAAVRAAYIGLGGTAVLGEVVGTLLRLLGAAIVLGVPTFLMGGTLPAAVRAVRQDTSRREVGLIYGINTLGAVVGAVLTTFFLLEFLGTAKTLWIAALLNLLLAFVARAIARRLESDEPVAAPIEAPIETPMETIGSQSDAPISASAPLWLVLGAAAGVGFVFLAMELVWYRMLGPILGGSTYTFGVILAVALLGIGIGGWLYSLGSGSRRPSSTAFAFTCSLEALFFALPLALGDRLAIFALALQDLNVTGFAGLATGWAIVTAVVALPAAIVAGYQFPLLVALLGSGRRQIAQQVGLAYAWNTGGAILGSLLGGFVLIPALGAPGVWRFNVVLLLVLAGLALVVRPKPTHGSPPDRWQYVAPTGVGLLALLLLLPQGLTAVWRHGGIGAGRMQLDYQGPNGLRDQLSSKRRSVIWELEGLESSIALVKSEGLAFTVNGKGDGSARGDAPTMVMSGLIGSALHPDPQDVLVIGLGTGASAGWLAEVPEVERVDVVELEPAVLQVAEACAPVNHDILDHTKATMILGDGREYLLTTDQRYDLIFSQPSNPYRAGISSLFTSEFYDAVRSRLKPGGVLVQWLQGYEVDAQVVRTAYATLASAFPSIETWQAGRLDLVLLASEAPLRPTPEMLAQRLSTEPYKSAMSHVWGIHGLPGFYAAYVGTPDFARALAEEAQAINTDDHPVIEFGFIRNLGRQGLFSIQELHQTSRLLGAATPPVPLDPALLAELRNARYAAFETPMPTPIDAPANQAQAQRFQARRAWSGGDLTAAARAWAAQDISPGLRADLTVVTEAFAEVGDDRVPELAERLRALQPIEADATLARWHLRQARPVEAARHLERAFLAYRSDPWPSYRLMARALDLAPSIAQAAPQTRQALYQALAEPFTVRMLDDLRLSTRLELAFGPDFENLCLDAFLDAEPYPSWSERYMTLRHRCYVLHDHPLAATAAADLIQFQQDSAPRLWNPERGETPAPLEVNPTPTPSVTDPPHPSPPAATDEQHDETS